MRRFLFVYVHGDRRHTLEITAKDRADAVARLRHQARAVFQREMPERTGVKAMLASFLRRQAARLDR